MDYENFRESKFPPYEQLKSGLIRLIEEGKITREDAGMLLPELRESKDEMIRKALVQEFKEKVQKSFEWKDGIPNNAVLAWLEKQKENPQSADSIPSNCTSDAKCEDRWHKVTDSLPDNGREVLAKDKLGNTLLARYDGEGWDVSVYDDEDYRCHNGISKWCEIPSEKQKDHFRDLTKMIELQDYSSLDDLERATHRGFLVAGVENAPVTLIKETANECKRIANENAEWSEEDKDMLNSCISSIEEAKENRYAYKETDGDTSYDHEIAWLESLRPVGKEFLQPHWKPSNTQINYLGAAVIEAQRRHNESVNGFPRYHALKELYEQLLKL